VRKQLARETNLKHKVNNVFSEQKKGQETFIVKKWAKRDNLSKKPEEKKGEEGEKTNPEDKLKQQMAQMTLEEGAQKEELKQEEAKIPEKSTEQQEKELYIQEMGFSLVVDMMIKAKKPLVGHNLMYDVIYFYN